MKFLFNSMIVVIWLLVGLLFGVIVGAISLAGIILFFGGVVGSIIHMIKVFFNLNINLFQLSLVVSLVTTSGMVIFLGGELREPAVSLILLVLNTLLAFSASGLIWLMSLTANRLCVVNESAK